MKCVQTKDQIYPAGKSCPLHIGIFAIDPIYPAGKSPLLWYAAVSIIATCPHRHVHFAAGIVMP